MHSAWLRGTFLGVLKCQQIKNGGPNFWVEPILQKVWIICSLLVYFNFKSFMNWNSSSFIRLEWILHDSGVLFWQSWNVHKLKGGELVCRGNQFCWMSQLFGSSFCISILKVSWTQFLPHSFDFNVFCMIEEYFSKSL